MERLTRKIKEVGGVELLADAAASHDDAAAIGPVSSAGALLSAVLTESTPDTLLVICPGVEYAEEFTEDVNLIKPGMACHFPALEIIPGDEQPPNEALVKHRLAVLRHLMFGTKERGGAELLEPEPQSRLVATSINALLQPVCSQQRLKEGARTIMVGQETTPRRLVEWLVDNGFYSTPQVEEAGTYSLRGGILDVFSHGSESPIRIEFFGDEIDSIRTFNPGTQLSRDRVQSWELVGPGDPLHNPAAGDSNLLEYLPPVAPVIVVEPAHVWHRSQKLWNAAEGEDFLADPANLRPSVSEHPTIRLGEPGEDLGPDALRIDAERRDVFGVDLDSAMDELRRMIDTFETVYLSYITDAEKQRLMALMDERDFLTPDNVTFVQGRLNHGVLFPRSGLAVVPHHRLFGRYRQRRTSSPAQQARPITEAGELSRGDTVVHVQYGIGKFRGLTVLERHGREQEHLEIEFADDARVYVPADRIEMVHRYIGVGAGDPKLSKLRGSRWNRAKERAEEAAEDLAAELLRLQAAREASEGISFPENTEWEQQFEAEFPYEETEDQLHAIENTLEDMHNSRPMDRLICGEVGFGKTEVAMRAAFKAVIGGYQVAVLVPTTILAQQHYRTFRERMADYPIRVEMLSRFVTAAEARETLDDMNRGTVDIVVGTHKLLQDDVSFDQLGLVVIDEEQRFGVRHKEKLKQMRTTVDVLTLTATPIPRTLHMALMGLRDISSLQTPPRERQAVETRVKEFDKDTLRHAVHRELNRDGQIYFVHNRVKSIERVANEVRGIVPEASLAIAHGQMPERQLADVMDDFTRGELDMLVSTTIIENGLDIPNANTLIVNRADLLGLAEMHQLRGRVGRYIHKAYAYFFIPPDRPITPKSRKRLKAIRKYSRLGAGFDIALRDLELRGAGNILGPQQSGHIAAVGYNLYCRLLERASSRLKGEPESEPPSVTINIGLDVVLPEDYVPELAQRIDLYRQLSQVTSREELQEVQQNIRDRFGPLPEPVRNMITETELALVADDAGINAIHRRDDTLRLNIRDMDQLVATLPDDAPLRISESERTALADVPSGCDTAQAVAEHLRALFRTSGKA